MTTNQNANAIPRHAAWGLWGGVGFVTLVFLIRGLSGAFTRELSTLEASCGATLAAGLSFSAFACDRFARSESISRKRFWLSPLLTILPPALLGLILMPSASSIGIAWLTVLTISLAVTVALVLKPDLLAALDRESSLEFSPSIPISEPAGATQWMARRLISEAGETWDQIEGRFEVDFAARQQHATYHLAISPPLPATPEIECEVLGEDEIEWKAAAIHPYGVRLELRRPSSEREAATVALGYTMAALKPADIEHAA